MNSQQYKEYLLLAWKKKSGKIKSSWREIGKDFDMSENGIRGRYKRFSQRNNISENSNEYDVNKAILNDIKCRSKLNLVFDDIPDIPKNKEKFKEECQETYIKETKDSISMNGVISSTSDKIDRDKILNDFLDNNNVDTDIWEVDQYKITKKDKSTVYRDQELQWLQGAMTGHSTRKPEYIKTTDYSINVTLKRKVNHFDRDRAYKEMLEDVKKDYSPSKKQLSALNHVKILDDDDRNLFIPLFFDVHLGRIFLENFDSALGISIEQAKQNVHNALYGMINEVKHKNIDKVLFIIGQDFLQFDNSLSYPKTSKGTPLDADANYQNMIRTARILLYTIIDTLVQIAPITVLTIPGNHERLSMYLMAEILIAKYEDNPHITIDNSIHERKYFQYGYNLIGTTHGENTKNAILHQLMSVEVPNMWADTKYRFWYCGHFHHEKELRSKSPSNIINGQDYKGVYIDYIPTLAKIDSYESKHGYCGTMKGAKAMIHNYVHGRINKIGMYI